MSHRKAHKLIGLRVTGTPLSLAQGAWLKEHLSGCPECAGRYDRAHSAVQAITGLAEDAAALPGNQALMADTFALLAQGTGAAACRPAFVPWPRLAALCAVLAVVIGLTWALSGPWFSNPDRSSVLLSRGGVDGLPEVGLGLSGIDDEGQEYEVVDSRGACLGHALRFYVSSRSEKLTHYFILGLQGNTVHWYFPSPEEGASYELPADPEQRIAAMVPWEIELWKRHRVGGIKVLGLFSERPLARADVEAAVSVLRREGEPEDWAKSIRAALGGDLATVEILLDVIDCGGGDE